MSSSIQLSFKSTLYELVPPSKWTPNLIKKFNSNIALQCLIPNLLLREKIREFFVLHCLEIYRNLIELSTYILYKSIEIKNEAFKLLLQNKKKTLFIEKNSKKAQKVKFL